MVGECHVNDRSSDDPPERCSCFWAWIHSSEAVSTASPQNRNDPSVVV